MLRLGSMCSGYGGLDIALSMALGDVEPQWFCEFAADPSLILAERFPGVPNYGDLLNHRWESAPAIDLLSAGFPCQPVSMAGNRKGSGTAAPKSRYHKRTALGEIVDADKRWIFDDICSAIGRMVARPRLLVFENVRGLLSANGGDAMARVVQGMARIGYVGRYRILPASAVGAPHRRERVFIIAWPVEDGDRPGIAWPGRRGGVDQPLAAGGNGRVARRGFTAVPLKAEGLMPTPIATDGSSQETTYKGSHKDGAAQVGAPSLTLLGAALELPTPTVWDAGHSQPENFGRPTLLGSLLPTPTTGDSQDGRGLRAGSGLTLDQAVGARRPDPAMPSGRLMPTPTAQDGSRGPDESSRQGSPSLGGTLLPTPMTSIDHKRDPAEDEQAALPNLLRGKGSAPLTSGGVPLTDALIQRLADEAERGYDPAKLLPTPTANDDHISRAKGGQPLLAGVAGQWPVNDTRPRPPADQLLPTPAASDDKRTTGPAPEHGWSGGLGGAVGLQGGLKSELLPTPTAHDRPEGKDAPGRTGGPSLPGKLLPTPIAHDATGKEFQYGQQPMLAGAVLDTSTTRPLPADWQDAAEEAIRDAEAAAEFHQDALPGMSAEVFAIAAPGVDQAVSHRLGVYGRAADRWAAIVGREAPDPTYVDPKDDRRKLSPAFGEWMMGLPAGWVTDVLAPRKALRAIGNGVVPQQAAQAVLLLLSTVVEEKGHE